MRTCTTIAHTHNTQGTNEFEKTQDGTSFCSEATTRVETTTNLLIINIEGELAVLQVEHLVPVVALIGNAQARANVCTRHMSVSCSSSAPSMAFITFFFMAAFAPTAGPSACVGMLHLLASSRAKTKAQVGMTSSERLVVFISLVLKLLLRCQLQQVPNLRSELGLELLHLLLFEQWCSRSNCRATLALIVAQSHVSDAKTVSPHPHEHIHMPLCQEMSVSTSLRFGSANRLFTLPGSKVRGVAPRLRRASRPRPG